MRTPDNVTLGSKIAPHHRKELFRVLDGFKPFAVISRDKDKSQFNAVLEFAHHLDIRCHRPNEVAFCLKDEGSHIFHTKYLSLLRVLDDRSMSRQEYQKQMGQLFGYSKQEIDAFITNPPNCNCHHCGGDLI